MPTDPLQLFLILAGAGFGLGCGFAAGIYFYQGVLAAFTAFGNQLGRIILWLILKARR